MLTAAPVAILSGRKLLSYAASITGAPAFGVCVGGPAEAA
jgi:hypothetical protein